MPSATLGDPPAQPAGALAQARLFLGERKVLEALTPARAALEEARHGTAERLEALSTLGEATALLGLDEEARPLLLEAHAGLAAAASPSQEALATNSLLLGEIEIQRSLNFYSYVESSDGYLQFLRGAAPEIADSAKRRRELEEAAVWELMRNREKEILATSLRVAEGRFAEASRQARSIGPAAFEIEGRSLVGRAMVTFYGGDRARSRTLLEEAITFLEQRLGAAHPALVKPLSSLGLVIYLSTQDAKATLPFFERAARIARDQLGLLHPETAEVLGFLRSIYVRTGDLERAVEAIEAELAFRKVAPDQAALQTSYEGAVKALSEGGQADRALSYAVAAARVSAERNGRNSGELLDDVLSLARTLEGEAYADFLWKVSLDPQERILDDQNPLLSQVLDELATRYSYLGRSEESKAVLRRRAELAVPLPSEAEALLAASRSDESLAMAEKLVDAGLHFGLVQSDPLTTLRLDERAAEITEKVAGPDSSKAALSLFRVALDLVAVGRDEDGDLRFEAYIARVRRKEPRDHVGAATALRYFADYLRERGDHARADDLDSEARGEQEHAVGAPVPSNAPQSAPPTARLPTSYSRDATEGDVAAELHRLSLAIVAPPELQEIRRRAEREPRYADFGRLADLADRAGSAGETELRRLFLWTASDIAVRLAPRNAASEASLLGQLAATYGDDEELPIAARLLGDAVERLLSDGSLASPELADSAKALVEVYRRQGRGQQAVEQLDRILAAQQAALGQAHSALVPILSLRNDIAFREEGSLDALAAAIDRLLSIPQALRPRTLPGLELQKLLGLALKRLRDADETQRAAALLQRVLAARKGALPKGDPAIAETALALAPLLRRLERDEEADSLLDLALESASAPAIAQPVNGLLGMQLREIADHRRAVAAAVAGLPAAQERVRQAEATLGVDDPALEEPLQALSSLYRSALRFADATDTDLRISRLRELLFGPPAKPPSAGKVLERLTLAGMEYGLGCNNAPGLSMTTDAALPVLACQRARDRLTGAKVAAHQAAIAENLARLSDSADRLAARDELRNDLLDHLAVKWALLQAVPAPAGVALADSLLWADFVRSGPAGEAVERLAERFAAGDAEAARLVRDRQEAQRQLRQSEGQLSKAVQKRATAEALQSLSAQVEAARIALRNAANRALQANPVLAATQRSGAPDLPRIQNLLRPHEALLVYLVGEKQSYLWVVRRHKLVLHALTLDLPEVRTQVGELLSQLDPEAPQTGQGPLPFDAATAYTLHERLIAPALPSLDGAETLYLLPDGALASVPFTALVRDAPPASHWTPDAPWNPAWLIERYALAVLPSLASLEVPRSPEAVHTASLPFLGFGGPVLDGAGGAAPVDGRAIRRHGKTDVALLRRLEPLLEAEAELRHLADLAGTDPGETVLAGPAMTEAALARRDLSRYRIVAFATHGLADNPLDPESEPALVMTPPAGDTQKVGDDGLLTASEIAALRLDAELVLLSACDTARSAARSGDDALAGLSSAFLFAGARSVLVTQGPVVSAAAAQLTVRMFAAARSDPVAQWPEVLRQAMAALAAGEAGATYRHPLYWAPFLLVGSGARHQTDGSTTTEETDERN